MALKTLFFAVTMAYICSCKQDLNPDLKLNLQPLL